MGKYDNLKTLKKTKARTQHVCYKCGKEISSGETYYREHIEDKFLHNVNPYCLRNLMIGKYAERTPFVHDSAEAFGSVI